MKDILKQVDPKVLLTEYLDIISVHRSKVGSILIIQDLKNGNQRVMDVYPYTDTDDQKTPDIKIAFHDEPLGEKGFADVVPTEITIKSTGDNQVIYKVDGNNIDGLDINHVAKATRQGLELLEAVSTLSINDPDLIRYKFLQRGVVDDAEVNQLTVVENLSTALINATPDDLSLLNSSDEFLKYAQKVLANFISATGPQ